MNLDNELTELGNSFVPILVEFKAGHKEGFGVWGCSAELRDIVEKWITKERVVEFAKKYNLEFKENNEN